MDMLSKLQPDIVKKGQHDETGWGGDIDQKLLAEGQNNIKTGDDSKSLGGWDWNNTQFVDVGVEKEISQDKQ